MPMKPEARVLKDRANRAREEAIARAGHSRPSPEHWFPSIIWLQELGYTDRQINSALGFETSGRYLRKIKQLGDVTGQKLVSIVSGPVPVERLDPKYQAMLEWSPEAFRAFYDEFNDFPLPDHCFEWVHEAMDNDLLLLNVPPRHNKSTTFSVWWATWLLVRDRNHQILEVSLSNTLAVEWVAYISYLLTTTEIPVIFGRFKPDKMDGEIPWRPSKGEIMIVGRTKVVRGPQFSILSRGQGQQILGFEANTVILDDVTDPDIATSETQRQKQINWVQNRCLSRLAPKGRAICIGQRVHVNDLYGYLADLTYTRGAKHGEPIWTHISHPAVLHWPTKDDDSDAVVLWPEVWPFEELMESYARIGGESAFETLYQQDPRAADATLVRDQWLEVCRDYHREAGKGVRGKTEDEEFFPIARVFAIDPSPTKYNGLVVADVVCSPDQFYASIIEVKSFKADLRGIKREIGRVMEEYHPSYFIFERNIAQHWLQGDPFFEELREKITVLPHDTYKNKGDEEYGLESLSGDFEFGRIRLPYADQPSRNVSKILEDEARNWTRQGRLKDDVLMALWFIKWNWRKFIPPNSLPTSFRGTAQREAAWRRRKRGQQDVVTEWRKRHRSRGLVSG